MVEVEDASNHQLRIAEILYGLIHARYIISGQGLASMVNDEIPEIKIKYFIFFFSIRSMLLRNSGSAQEPAAMVKLHFLYELSPILILCA